MPHAGVDDLIKKGSPTYDTAGVYDHFKVSPPDTNHIFLPEYFEWTVDWYNEHL